MRFIKKNDIYEVIRITGPSHNLLGLVLTDNDINIEDINVITLPKKNGDLIGLNILDVKYQVLIGLNEINLQLNTKYNIACIYFIESDTPNLETYKYLTQELIFRIHTKGKFEFI